MSVESLQYITAKVVIETRDIRNFSEKSIVVQSLFKGAIDQNPIKNQKFLLKQLETDEGTNVIKKRNYVSVIGENFINQRINVLKREYSDYLEQTQCYQARSGGRKGPHYPSLDEMRHLGGMLKIIENLSSSLR